jgi:hypothetical protein
MLQVKLRDRHAQVFLKQGTIQSDLVFVLVDDCVGLQIRYFESKKKQFVQGDYLLLRDREAELINSLGRMFSSIESNAHPVTEKDLRQRR